MNQHKQTILLILVSVFLGVTLTLSTLLWSLPVVILVASLLLIHALLGVIFSRKWAQLHQQVNQNQQLASGLSIDLWAQAYRQYFKLSHCLLVSILITLVLFLLNLYGSQFWSLVITAGLLAASFPFMFGFLPLNYSALFALCWQVDYPCLSQGWLDYFKSSVLLRAQFDGASETLVEKDHAQYSQLVTVVQSAQVSDGGAMVKMANLREVSLIEPVRQRAIASMPIFIIAAIVMVLSLNFWSMNRNFLPQQFEATQLRTIEQNSDKQAVGDSVRGDGQKQDSGDGSQGAEQSQGSGDGSQGAEQSQGSGDGSQGAEQSQGSGDGSQGDEQSQGSGDGSQGDEQSQGSGDGSQGGEQSQGSGDGSQGGEQSQGSGDGSQGGEQSQGSGDGSQGGEQSQGSGGGSQGGEQSQGSDDGSQGGEQSQDVQGSEQAQGSGEGLQGTAQPSGVGALIKSNVNDNGPMIEIELPQLAPFGQGIGDAKSDIRPNEQRATTNQRDTLNLHEKQKQQDDARLPTWILLLLKDKGL